MGGAAFIVNSVTVWVLMMTIMSESHTKAKDRCKYCRNYLLLAHEPTVDPSATLPENWKREAVELVWSTCSVFSLEAGCVAFSTYVLNLRTPRRPSSPVRSSVPFWAPFFATSLPLLVYGSHRQKVERGEGTDHEGARPYV